MSRDVEPIAPGTGLRKRLIGWVETPRLCTKKGGVTGGMTGAQEAAGAPHGATNRTIDG